MSSFRSTVLQDAPRLSWCAHITRGLHVRVLHGADVHVGQNWFAEGAWDSSFDPKGFSESRYMLGSGGIIGKNIRFRGASHTLERLWVLPIEGNIWVSNSLPFVLSASGRKVPLANYHAEADLLAFIDGIDSSRRAIELNDGSTLRQVVHADFEVDETLRVEHRVLPEPLTFSSYEDYYRELLRTCRAVVDNARAAVRSLRFQPLATVSRGYDSPACAALAASSGAQRAITFSNARTGYKLDNDDGTEIAQQLTLSATAFSRTDHFSDGPLTACRFIASGGGGEDVVLAGASSMLNGSVLFTGFLGDTLWGLQGDPKQTARLKIMYPGGGSIGEFRLHTGFVHLPIPILHLRCHESLLAISMSAEMRSFAIGGDYDRPIPRRIAEEAGVHRNAFGLSKMAVTAPMYYDVPLEDFLNETAIARFGQFIRNHEPEIARSLAAYATGRKPQIRKRFLLDRINWRASASRWKWLSTLTEARVSDRWRREPSEKLFLTHWGIAEIQQLYDHALRECAR